MEHTQELEICLSMITGRDLLVLATCGPQGPHTSLMAYAASPDGREVWMVTSARSRKWDNIMADPRVSLLIDDREALEQAGRDGIRALTIAGEHLPVSRAEDEAAIRASLLKRHPGLSEFFDGPGPRLIRVRVRSFLLLSGRTEAYFHDFIGER